MNAAIHHPGRVIAIGVAVAIAIMALLPGSWASAQTVTTTSTPVPTVSIQPTVVTVPPNASATVQAGASTTLRVPAGSLSEGATITVGVAIQTGGAPISAQSFTDLGVPPPPAATGNGVVLSVFNLDAITSGGTEATINEPVEIDFELTAEQLAAAGGDANNVELQFLDTTVTPAAWTSVSCSGSGTTVTCTLPHFSLWALAIREVADPGQVATPSPADTGMGATAESGATNTMAIALGVVALAGILGAGAKFAMGRRRI